MSAVYDLLIGPFLDFAFMRRALIGIIALALGSGPIGTLLVLRRMSLMGDAMSHAVLPGAAIGFLLAGLSLPAMSLGGVIAGLSVALMSGLVTRLTPLREDASFAAFYLISLALGVLIVSMRGSNIDLLHVLFGTILGVDDQALILVATISTVTLLALALIYRPLIVECFDPGFLTSIGTDGGRIHAAFLLLVVLNLVAGFQALGTLMAVGLMMLPAAAARFWAREVWSLAAISSLIACLAGYAGLVLSYRCAVPSGPAIILTAGAIYIVSLLLGRRDSVRARYWLALVLVALGVWRPAAAAEALPVVASFSILGDMTSIIGGDDISLVTLVGPDGDAHVYQPSPADVRRVAAAKLLIINGLGFETWLPRLTRAAGFTGMMVTASDGISVLRAGDVPDPHAWQDLANGRIYAGNIAAALAAADPAHAADFAKRAEAYQAALADLDQWVRAEIAAVPPAQRDIVTTHAAFGYFGRAYGVRLYAPVGISEDSDPSAAAIARLIRVIRTNQITALFTEATSDRHLLDQIAHEAMIPAGGSLFSDALSQPGEGGESYIALFRHNVQQMVSAMRRNGDMR